MLVFNKKVTLIIGVIVVVAMVAFIVIFPLSKNNTSQTSKSTSSSAIISTSSTPGTTGFSGVAPGPPPPEDTQYVDDQTSFDRALDRFPIINNNYSLFYSADRIVLASINAKEGTAEARMAKNDIIKWFSEQDVDMSDIKIDYLYKR